MELSYHFWSKALEGKLKDDPNYIRVVNFSGEEEISRPFWFEIELIASDPNIDLESVVNEPASLEITARDGEKFKFHGVLSHFEQRGQERIPGYKGDESWARYWAVLVPKLFLLSQRRQNQVHFPEGEKEGKTVKDIIEAELKDTGLADKKDFEFLLNSEYPKRDYVVQYKETDLNFISRLMEHDGIFYYFKHDDKGTKMVVGDKNDHFTEIESIAGEEEKNTITYNTAHLQSPKESIWSLICQQQRLPKQLILRDYNYRKPSMDLKTEETIDEKGDGIISDYGDHFKDKDEGKTLAKVRAEEIRCGRKLFLGEGDCMRFRAGYRFKLKGHYRTDLNDKEYIITRVRHEGAQSGPGRSGKGENGAGEVPEYSNEFTAIPAEVIFRPERITPKPKVYGIMNAVVDAAGSGDYAELDEEGRYKVVVPFDLTGKGDAKASRFIRMAQPYAGGNYGMHFPLHKGIEVIWTCIDGDPDRPVICGSIPNPETMSPVTGGNQTQSVIRTGGGNQIRIEDNDGGQQIHLSSPASNSIISLGAVNEGNIYLRSDGTWVSDIGGDAEEKVAGKKTNTVTGNEDKTISSDQKLTVTGSQTETIGAGATRTVTGDQNITITGKEDKKIGGPSFWSTKGFSKKSNLAATEELFVGAKATQNLAATSELTAGVKQSAFVGVEIVTNASAKIDKCAAVDLLEASTILSKCAGASKVWAGAYDLIVMGALDMSGSPITIKNGGSTITVNGGDIAIKAGTIKIEGDIRLKGNLIGTGFSHFKKDIDGKDVKS
ncbi:type VI secretion system Vgr family protein [Thermodesulfobacteriota bacterium]